MSHQRKNNTVQQVGGKCYVHSFTGFHLNITSLLLFSHHVILSSSSSKLPSLRWYANISLPLHVQRLQIWYAVLHVYLVSKSDFWNKFYTRTRFS
jgi:hypothetical protein